MCPSTFYTTCVMRFLFIFASYLQSIPAFRLFSPFHTSVTHFRSTSTVFRILHTISTDFLYLCRKRRYARMNIHKVPYFWPIFKRKLHEMCRGNLVEIPDMEFHYRSRGVPCGRAGGLMERHDEVNC